MMQQKNSNKSIFVWLLIFSISILISFMSCTQNAGETDSRDSLFGFTFTKSGDESPIGYIKTGEHGKSYFKATALESKSKGFGWDTVDYSDKAIIKIISVEGIQSDIEITDSKTYNFKHGITYQLECSLKDYSNTATLTCKAVKEGDMYGDATQEQTLIRGLIYPYHQYFASFTNSNCTISTNQYRYLDEDLNKTFTMFYGSSLLTCNKKVTDIKNLTITDDLKCVMIYGVGGLDKPTTDYIPLTFTNSIDDMKSDTSLFVTNYLDGDNKQYKFENQIVNQEVTNYGKNLFMQANATGNGYVKFTDEDGNLLDGITLTIHETNFNENWKSTDVIAKDITSSNKWTPTVKGVYYVEVSCMIGSKNYSNTYSTTNRIEVKPE